MSGWTKEKMEAVMDRFVKVFEEQVIASGGKVISVSAAQQAVEDRPATLPESDDHQDTRAA